MRPRRCPPEELARLGAEDLREAPDWVAADMPEWLFAEFKAAFEGRAIAEGEALAARAPIDLRVNTLKADRPRVLKALEKYKAAPTLFSPVGIRIPAPGPLEKNPNVEAEAAHGRGWFEVQDEASQIAAFLSGAAPRLQVLDLCAGSGGKTLAMAALIQNTGQIYAYDSDKLRLRPIFDRLRRSGARNVQVLAAGDEAALADLRGRMDIVFVDAPCSGSGVWRRRPDAKWRLTPEALAERIAEQRRVLTLAAPLVRPGGRLVYATCSVLPSENAEQTRWFLENVPEFAEIAWRGIWQSAPLAPPPEVETGSFALQLTPAGHGTDGFLYQYSGTGGLSLRSSGIGYESCIEIRQFRPILAVVLVLGGVRPVGWYWNRGRESPVSSQTFCLRFLRELSRPALSRRIGKRAEKWV